jgi:antitoxin HicB
MYAYPAVFTREGKAVVVSFPDVPEAVTNSYNDAEAEEYAVDALKLVLQEYMKGKQPLPRASKRRRGMRLIPLPAVVQAKLELYTALQQAGMRKAELARRLDRPRSQVDRLLDLRYASRMDQLEAGLALLGKRSAAPLHHTPKKDGA